VIHGNGRAALEEAVQLLEKGRTVIIFPEGAISPLEGGFHRAHTGIARMALRTGVPVVPVGIGLDRERIRLVETEVDGKTEVGTWYLSGPYAMTVGEPMVFEGDVEDREYVREVSTQIMERIIQLAHRSTARVKASQAYANDAITRPVPVTSIS
jgi:1-acyl-sn-glycerol-3-phosphate acyltransferase